MASSIKLQADNIWSGSRSGFIAYLAQCYRENKHAYIPRDMVPVLLDIFNASHSFRYTYI